MAGSEIRRARTPVGEMVLFDDGVLVHTLDEGALINERTAHEVLAITAELAAGTPVAVVVDLTRVAFADPESRDVFAVEPAGGPEVATALVAGAKIAGFLAGRFMSLAQLSRPVQLFESVDDATAWAAERVAAVRGA